MKMIKKQKREKNNTYVDDDGGASVNIASLVGGSAECFKSIVADICIRVVSGSTRGQGVSLTLQRSPRKQQNFCVLNFLREELTLKEHHLSLLLHCGSYFQTAKCSQLLQ